MAKIPNANSFPVNGMAGNSMNVEMNTNHFKNGSTDGEGM